GPRAVWGLWRGWGGPCGGLRGQEGRHPGRLAQQGGQHLHRLLEPGLLGPAYPAAAQLRDAHHARGPRSAQGCQRQVATGADHGPSPVISFRAVTCTVTPAGAAAYTTVCAMVSTVWSSLNFTR